MTEKRAVWLIRGGPMGPAIALCENCISTAYDGKAIQDNIARRDDTAHCIECDWHAEAGSAMACGCSANDSFTAYSAEIERRIQG